MKEFSLLGFVAHLVVVEAELHEFGEALVRKAHEMVEDAARRRGQGHEVEAVENLRVLGNGGACHRVVILPWSVRPKSVCCGGWALSLPPLRARRRRVGHGLIGCSRNPPNEGISLSDLPSRAVVLSCNVLQAR